MIHLETHVLLWIVSGNDARIPPGVRRLLETAPLMISPMIELEITYLFEIGRVAEPAAVVLARCRPVLDLVTSTASFISIVGAANALSWTQDPFDRLIAGNALADGCELLTADVTMRTHMPSARWD